MAFGRVSVAGNVGTAVPCVICEAVVVLSDATPLSTLDVCPSGSSFARGTQVLHVGAGRRNFACSYAQFAPAAWAVPAPNLSGLLQRADVFAPASLVRRVVIFNASPVDTLPESIAWMCC